MIAKETKRCPRCKSMVSLFSSSSVRGYMCANVQCDWSMYIPLRLDEVKKLVAKIVEPLNPVNDEVKKVTGTIPLFPI